MEPESEMKKYLNSIKLQKVKNQKEKSRAIMKEMKHKIGPEYWQKTQVNTKVGIIKGLMHRNNISFD